jgi:hypothetical protein
MNPPAPIRHHRDGRVVPTETSIKPEWSTTKPLDAKYLTPVHDGLLASALKYHLVLDARDLHWLSAHPGQFQKFIHPQSSVGRTLFQSANCGRDVSIAATLLLARHQVWGVSPRFGSAQNAPNYHNNLESFLNQFWRWLCFRQKFESMLILLPNPPRRCPAIDQRELLLFLMFKYLPTNTVVQLGPYRPITDEQGCVDFLGNVMKCEGSVNNIKYMDTFFAGVRQLHIECDHMSDYVAACPDCVVLYIQTDHSLRMCPDCFVPGFQHRGNPTCHKEVKHFRHWLVLESERRKYIEKPRSPMFPSDLLDIHRYIEACGFRDRKNFEFYLMVLCGIYLYARFDEFHDIEIKDFEDSRAQVLFNISPSSIDCISVMIDGSKNHKDDAFYQIFFNEEMPRQCFLRHLLIWLHVTQVRFAFYLLSLVFFIYMPLITLFHLLLRLMKVLFFQSHRTWRKTP